MDPTSFTQTSFCGSTVDNITTNESKGYILNHMSIMCSGKTYQSKYAKLFNERFSKNLRNPHIICLKSGGTPYFMFLTQINETNYCFLIDKKIKEGYDYPKIFIVPYLFKKECYQGSLFECELIRDRNEQWLLSVGDCYTMYGRSMKKVIIIDRINKMKEFFEKDMLESLFMKTCPLQIKKYFDYKDMREIKDEFISRLSYDIRGYYFIPLRTDYSNILYLYSRNQKKISNSINISENKKGKEKENGKGEKIKNMKNNNKIFRIMKTMKPDVYELYSQENEDIQKIGILLVQTIQESHMLAKHFMNKDQFSEEYIQCEYDTYFEKWRPLKFIEK